jgi:hypothetical protein
MPSIEHTERFLAECFLYRAAMKAKPLTRSELVLVRTRLSELLFDLDAEGEASVSWWEKWLTAIRRNRQSLAGSAE